mgnify:FL=1
MNKFLPTKISITRPSGGGADYVQLEIEDATSGSILFQTRVPLAEFTEAITGLSSRPCETMALGVKYFGMKLETKVQVVPKIEDDGLWKNRGQTEKKAVAPFEVDGWKARQGDYGNHHRSIKTAGTDAAYNVNFYRYVNPETGESVL